MGSSQSSACGLLLQLSAKSAQQRSPCTYSAHHLPHPGQPRGEVIAPLPAPVPAQPLLIKFQVLLPEIWGMTNFIIFHACPRNSPINAMEEKGNRGDVRPLGCAMEGDG